MKVIHVTGSVSLKRGGPSQAIWGMAMGLQKSGIEVCIATTDDDGPHSRLDVTYNQFVDVNGVPVIYFPRQTSFYASSWPLYSWLKDHISDYDLVHAHGLFTFAPLAAARAAFLNQVPYIIRPLGTLNRWGRANRRPFLKNLSIRHVESRILQHAAAVHFTSTDEADQAAELGLGYDSFVLPLGFDLANLVPSVSPKVIYGRYPELENRRVLLFLSRLDKKKGLELLLNAFARIHEERPDTLLVIAGSGTPEYVEALKLLATKLGIESEIVWTGFVEGEEKHPCLLPQRFLSCRRIQKILASSS